MAIVNTCLTSASASVIPADTQLLSFDHERTYGYEWLGSEVEINLKSKTLYSYSRDIKANFILASRV